MLALFSILMFLAVTLTTVAIVFWFMPSRTHQRLVQVSPRQAGGHWTETVAKASGPLARLSMPDGDWESSALRVRFLNAGIRRNEARLVYFAAKTVFPLVFGLAVFTLLRAMNKTELMPILFGVTVAALVGCYLPNLWLALKVRSRKREIFENFPDAADLMLVCVEAGLGLDSGMNKVAEEVSRKSAALAEELQLTNLEIRAGASRDQALRNLAVRTGVDDTRAFSTMLIQADKFGTSVGDSLRVFSDELRHKRMVRAEEKAAKVPTKMLFPLVMFIFPAILMVVLGPAIIQVVRTLLPMLGGAR